MISRNINKLFRVINFLLQCDATVVTENYYITNGRIDIRKSIVREAHGTKDANKKLLYTKGLSAKHADALKNVAKSIL